MSFTTADYPPPRISRMLKRPIDEYTELRRRLFKAGVSVEDWVYTIPKTDADARKAIEWMKLRLIAADFEED